MKFQRFTAGVKYDILFYRPSSTTERPGGIYRCSAEGREAWRLPGIRKFPDLSARSDTQECKRKITGRHDFNAADGDEEQFVTEVLEIQSVSSAVMETD